MKYLTISLYLISLIIQATTVFQCVTAYKYIGKLRTGWILLGFAFSVVFLHRIFACLIILGDLAFHLMDAIFSLTVSVLFLLGVMAIRRASQSQQQKNVELQTLNKYDSLTQALSRAETLSRLDMEIERAERFSHPLAVFEIDIDHFKRINDEYGHQVGDEILKSLTQCCQDVLRANDAFGRMGGEEFLIILPESDQYHAMEAAERLRRVVESYLHLTSAKETLKITVSIGVACYVPNTNPDRDKYLVVQELVRHADQAMYQAKEAGRNRTVLWLAPVTHSVKNNL